MCGHTGLSKAVYFDNIEKLTKGDKFYIKYLDKILAYNVIEINTVLPDDTDTLKIQKDKDLVTLVTCTPRFINSHRLLVTGSRVPLDREEINKINDTINNSVKKKSIVIKGIINLLGIAILSMIILIIVILIFKFSNKEKIIKN